MYDYSERFTWVNGTANSSAKPAASIKLPKPCRPSRTCDFPSIGFIFDENDNRTAFIQLPIVNLSKDAPLAKYIVKLLDSLGCKVTKHTFASSYCREDKRMKCQPEIHFTGSTEAMKALVAIYGTPFQQVPESATKVFADKFLWRTIIRPMFPPGTGTPVVVDTSHLTELQSALNRIDEYTSKSYSSGRIHYGAVTRNDLANLEPLIKAIKQDGFALVVD